MATGQGFSSPAELMITYGNHASGGHAEVVIQARCRCALQCSCEVKVMVMKSFSNDWTQRLIFK